MHRRTHGQAGKRTNAHATHWLSITCITTTFLVVCAGAWAQQNPWRDATLYRDEWGVPHIYASTPAALAFAFGYAQAEDHLDAMLLAYRMANGRAAEVFGETYANSDAHALKMGHARMAADAWPGLDELTQTLCVGFAQGVNTWIAGHPRQAPAWAEPVAPADILALWHAYLMSFAPLDLPGALDTAPAAYSGNAWAMGPERMEEGAAVLVINPHQYHNGPFRWYEAHLAGAGMDVTGATLYGLPVIVQGHNGALGWALTPNAADFADVFEETLAPPQTNPKDPRMVDRTSDPTMILRYMSQAQPYGVRTADGMEERFVPAMVTPRGPVLEDGGGKLHAWRIGGFDQLGGLRQLVEMARARDLAAFQDVLLMQQLPCFHITYADARGNIFYLYNARTGSRELPPDAAGDPALQAPGWKLPLPAAWEGWAWSSVVPPEALPSITNPATGFLQACGNPPWAATDDAPVRAGDVPFWFAPDYDSYRARRVRQLLRAGSRNLRDHQAMLYDTMAPAAADAAPALLAMAASQEEAVKNAHPDLAPALGLLEDWNFMASPESPAMTFYHLWWTILRRNTASTLPHDGARYAMLASASPAAAQAALNAAEEAARLMRNEFQGISVPWGEVHKITRGPREETMPGAETGEPIFVAGDGVYGSGAWQTGYGYGFAMTVLFTDPPAAYSMTPFGASDRPGSPHFDDQLDLMLEGRLKRTRFARDSVWRYARRARGCDVVLYPLGVEGAFRFQGDTVFEARLRTGKEPPAPLPEGMAPFTLFVRPERAPASAPVQTTVRFTVPEAAAHASGLPHLAIFIHEAGLGWRRMPQQQLDASARTFEGMHHGGGVYAVLGPEQWFQPGAMAAAGEQAPPPVGEGSVPPPPLRQPKQGESPDLAFNPPPLRPSQASPESPRAPVPAAAPNPGPPARVPNVPLPVGDEVPEEGGIIKLQHGTANAGPPALPPAPSPAPPAQQGAAPRAFTNIGTDGRIEERKAGQGDAPPPPRIFTNVGTGGDVVVRESNESGE